MHMPSSGQNHAGSVSTKVNDILARAAVLTAASLVTQCATSKSRSSSSGPYARKSSSVVEADATQEPESKVARKQAEPEPKAEAEAEAWRREDLGDLLENVFLKVQNAAWRAVGLCLEAFLPARIRDASICSGQQRQQQQQGASSTHVCEADLQ